MPSVLQPLSSLLVSGVHRFAECLILTRTDTTVLAYTDHDVKLTIDGIVFQPGLGGVSLSSRQAKEGTDAANLDVSGGVVIDGISDDDLLAGLYRGATVEQFVVDWRYPWGGKMYHSKYTVQEPVFDGREWHATFVGAKHRLTLRTGGVFSRLCRWKRLGDANCTFNVASVTLHGKIVSAIDVDSLSFLSNVTGADDYFNDGIITWLTGLNAGTQSVVKTHVSTGGSIELWVATPFAIAATDTFDIEPGCDREADTCEVKFNNLLNHGGYPFIRGNRAARSTPSQST